MRQGEDYVDIAGGQKVPAARFQPMVAGIGLTLRAVPVPTRVEGDDAMSAVETLIQMAAERGGAAAQDRCEDFQMKPSEPLTAAIEESVSRCADNIGHLQGRPRHLLRLR